MERAPAERDGQTEGISIHVAKRPRETMRNECHNEVNNLFEVIFVESMYLFSFLLFSREKRIRQKIARVRLLAEQPKEKKKEIPELRQPNYRRTGISYRGNKAE